MVSSVFIFGVVMGLEEGVKKHAGGMFFSPGESPSISGGIP